VKLREPVTGWRIGDRVLLTPAIDTSAKSQQKSDTEQHAIAAIDGSTITLDAPLASTHGGQPEESAEIANLSRNVIIESADPDGVRGHTMYHSASSGFDQLRRVPPSRQKRNPRQIRDPLPSRRKFHARQRRRRRFDLGFG